METLRMGRMLVVAGILLAGTAVCVAQTPDTWARKMFVKDGAIHLEHDFGTVPRGTILTYRFPVTNIYAVPLRISEINPGCNCVTAVGPPQALAANESGFIEVTMNARQFTGPKTVKIKATITGEKHFSYVELKLTANSRADVVLNPGQVTFGQVPLGQTPTQTVDIEYAGSLDWKITGLVQTNAPVEVKQQELYRRPGQVGYRLHVTLKKDATAGTLKQEIMLQTNDPASPLLPVLVEAMIQAPLAVVPDVLPMGTVPVGQSATRRVVVRGTNKPFKILRIDGKGDGITVEAPNSAQPVQILTITFTPTKPGEIRKVLTVVTDLGTETVATVTVVGTAQ